jgi:MraZ protein
MLRGSSQARIDDKGRLKVPTGFLRLFEERFGPDIFLTSIEGDSALLFPLSVWEEREAKLATLPASDPVRRRYLERASYFGQQSQLDGQGRVVIPQLLRDVAGIVGDVSVGGRLDHLEIWNLERLQRRFAAQPFGDEDYQYLSDRGV